VQVDTIYEASARIIYIDFDHLAEQESRNTSEHSTHLKDNDIFFVIDSSKKIHRLVERHVLVEGVGIDQVFEKKNVYQCVETIDLEKRVGETILNALDLDKIFNEKYPFFNISMRTLQYKNISIGFDTGLKIQTLKN